MNVYDALQNNVMYKIEITMNFTMVPRVSDGVIYYQLAVMAVTNVVSTNFPRCYTDIQGSVSSYGMVVMFKLNESADCQSFIDNRTELV